MPALENGPRTDGEVKLTLVAAVKTLFTGRQTLTGSASWANRTLAPETAFKVDAGRLLI